MSNPRIEEIDDDDDDEEMAEDPDEVDLDDAFDFARPQKGTLQSSTDPSGSQMSSEAIEAMLQPQQQGPSTSESSRPPPQMSDKDRERLASEQREKTKQYQCIYPVYFDASRSREQGRRVKREDAVSNPLARDLVDALQYVGTQVGVGLQIVFEPSKTHPKDWANPGRVRCLVKREGRAVSAKVRNKHQLYKMIADYLKSHPTTEDSPMRLRLQGMPMPEERPPPPAIPRGFKMGTILPLHSPALSGGGVSDNFLKDMMAEMGGQLPPGMEGMASLAGAGGGGGGGGQPKKIRVKAGRK